jgi:hypothetical protein
MIYSQVRALEIICAMNVKDLAILPHGMDLTVCSMCTICARELYTCAMRYFVSGHHFSLSQK